MMAQTNYVLLDAARMDDKFDEAIALNPENECLFNGKGEEYFRPVSPFLFKYFKNDEFNKWVEYLGWGNSWGMFINTEVSLEELTKHFRKFLLVKTEEQRELFFRFYDPRVLRIFLPTCDAMQLKDFFGPVKVFGMESEDPEFAIQFELQNGKLISKKVVKQEFWNQLNEVSVSAKADTEIRIDPADDKKDKPGRKWNFLID